MFKSKFFKMSALLTMGTLLFGITGAVLPALADEDSATVDNTCAREIAGKRDGKMGAGLDQALENGRISQEQYDAMKAIQDKMAELKGDFADLAPEERRAAIEDARAEILGELLADGTISQDIYDRMIAGPPERPDFRGKLGLGLDQALENGKISQEQYDSMIAVRDKMAELKGDFADLTPDERRAAMEDARAEILGELLADGTISQDMYDRMIAGPPERFNFRGKLGLGLDQALENGKISQEQYDSMIAVRDKMEELKGDFADLAPEERRAAIEDARADILGELLADGTISQDIYDRMIAGPIHQGLAIK